LVDGYDLELWDGPRFIIRLKVAVIIERLLEPGSTEMASAFTSPA
jgi:hypothetical protein